MTAVSGMRVADALAVPPLDQGRLVAGHSGLDRRILWADIAHSPGQSFIRDGDLILTTGADPSREADREFLSSVIKSPAAGMVLSPPSEDHVNHYLPSLVALADRARFPVILLPWEIPFADVMRSLLPKLSPAWPEIHTKLALGRRVRSHADWLEQTERFQQLLPRIAEAKGITATCTVTDELILVAFVLGPSNPDLQEVIDDIQQASEFPDDVLSWEILPSGPGDPANPLPDFGRLSAGPLGPQQFIEVLKHHPRSMAAVSATLRPLIEYDRTRRGQLVHTLDLLLRQGLNVSATARILYLNRHSLLYRISLIEQLTGLSLKSPSGRFLLETSIRVHRAAMRSTDAADPRAASADR